MSILFDNPPPAIGCGDPGDPIDFSCLFEGGGLRRIASSGGDQTRVAASMWVKRTKADTAQFIWGWRASNATGSGYGWLQYKSNNKLSFVYNDNTHSLVVEYSGAHRDFAGHSDIYFELDTNVSGIPALTVDGKALTPTITSGTAFPTGYQTVFNTNGYYCRIGYEAVTGYATQGYVSKFEQTDGILPGAEAFAYRTAYGHWVPKKYNGLYGNNGFHLDFADPLDLGKDVSGNSNHFTASGLTVDNQVTDTPSKNCTTLNPLYADSAKITPTNGNLTAIGNASSPAANNVAGTHIIRHKAFFAMQPVALGNGSFYIGLQSADGLTYCYRQDGATVLAGAVSAYGAAFAVGDWVGCGYDPVTGNIEFFKLVSGVWVSQGILPAAISAADVLPWVYASHQTRVDVNFGQRAWPAELPEGYSAHSTPSMPCPAILNPDDYFTVRKVGDTTPLPWNPLVHKTLAVTKDRDGSTSWRVNDTVRGDGKAWACDVGGAEINEGANGASWTTAGPVYGSAAQYQGNRITWFWRASPKAGFDIVEINHVNGTPSTIAHKAGGLIEYAWVVPLDGGDVREFHHRLAPGEFLRMNDYDYPLGVDAGWFSSTGNSVTLGASMTSGRYIAYLWRAVPQFSAFELYGGTGNADGEFLPLDFEARLHLFRRKNAAASCTAICADIETSNPAKRYTRLTLPNPESTEAGLELDIYSNGTKPRGLAAAMNYNGHTYLTADWARTPGKFARAR